MYNKHLAPSSEKTATNGHADRVNANVERDEAPGAKPPGWANLCVFTMCLYYLVAKLEEYAPDWREQLWQIYVVESPGALVIITALVWLALLEPEHTDAHWLKWATWLGHKTMPAIFGFMLFLLLFGPVLVKRGEMKNTTTPPPEKSSATKPDFTKPPAPTTTSSHPVAPNGEPDVQN